MPLQDFWRETVAAALFAVSALTASLATSQAQAEELDRNALLRQYGQVSTGLALEERCQLLPAAEAREYYWHQFQIDLALNRVFAGEPTLSMIRGSALQAAQSDSFACGEKSAAFLAENLERARGLSLEVSGATFKPGVSDRELDEARLAIVARSAGTEDRCHHLLEGYDQQLLKGYDALKDGYVKRYGNNARPDEMDRARGRARDSETPACGEETRRTVLQGWQLSRLLLKEFRLKLTE